MTISRQVTKPYRHYLFALVAAVTLVACTDVGETGGTAGGGGMGGGAGEGGGGMGGMGGMGGDGGTNTSPEATIVAPASDSGVNDEVYAYDGFDSDLGLWYTDVDLEGLGQDEEDGMLSGDALVWKTNRTDLQEELLGTGTNPTVRLYSDECVGVEHIIRLEATDSDDAATTSAPRSIRIWTLC
ncbi:MAG: hypothetical protein WBN10_20160 [Polyangiales bacterium]